MATLGVNASTQELWLALVVDDVAESDASAGRITLPAGDPGVALQAVREDISSVLVRTSPDRVVILNPEPNAKHSYVSSWSRAAMEAVVCLAAADASIPVWQMSRSKLRSVLGLPREGKLVEIGESLVAPVGAHWRAKRDLAALAALAGERS